MEILIKNAAVTDVLNDIGNAFRERCPADYDLFIKHVQEESTKLIKPSGMSEGGTLMNFMKIPMATNSLGKRISLYAFIRWQMQKRCGIDDFFRDKKNYYLLCQVWRDAWVKKNPTPFLRVGGECQNPPLPVSQSA